MHGIALLTYAQGAFWWTVAGTLLVGVTIVLASLGLWLQVRDRRQRHQKEALQAEPFDRVRCWVQIDPIDRLHIEQRQPDHDNGGTLQFPLGSRHLYIQAFARTNISVEEVNLRFLGDATTKPIVMNATDTNRPDLVSNSRRVVRGGFDLGYRSPRPLPQGRAINYIVDFEAHYANWRGEFGLRFELTIGSVRLTIPCLTLDEQNEKDCQRG